MGICDCGATGDITGVNGVCALTMWPINKFANRKATGITLPGGLVPGLWFVDEATALTEVAWDALLGATGADKVALTDRIIYDQNIAKSEAITQGADGDTSTPFNIVMKTGATSPVVTVNALYTTAPAYDAMKDLECVDKNEGLQFIFIDAENNRAWALKDESGAIYGFPSTPHSYFVSSPESVGTALNNYTITFNIPKDWGTKLIELKGFDFNLGTKLNA